MAPEQRLSAKKTTHQADIYALGATLFAMLSHEDPTELYDQTAHRQLFAKLPDNIALLIATACHTDLQQRYQNADELIAAIDQLLCDTGPSIQLSKKDFSTPVNLEELHRDWQSYTGNGDDDTQPNTQDNPTDTMFFEGLAGAGLAFSDVVDDTRVKGPNFQENHQKDPSRSTCSPTKQPKPALIFVTVLLDHHLPDLSSIWQAQDCAANRTPATIWHSAPKSDADQDTMNRAITATLTVSFMLRRALSFQAEAELSQRASCVLMDCLAAQRKVAARAVLRVSNWQAGDPSLQQLAQESVREPLPHNGQWSALRSTHNDPITDCCICRRSSYPTTARHPPAAKREPHQALFAYGIFVLVTARGGKQRA